MTAQRDCQVARGDGLAFRSESGCQDHHLRRAVRVTELQICPQGTKGLDMCGIGLEHDQGTV